MDIKITHNAFDIAEAVAKGGAQVLKNVDAALSRGAIELADEIKQQAPKATSTLTNSVQIKGKPLEWSVIVAAAYAGYVHQGTKEGGRPSLAAMIEWIRLKNIKPRDPTMKPQALAHLLRRSIAMKGTPANPFATRALDAKTSRLTELVQAAALAGIAGGGA